MLLGRTTLARPVAVRSSTSALSYGTTAHNRRHVLTSVRRRTYADESLEDEQLMAAVESTGDDRQLLMIRERRRQFVETVREHLREQMDAELVHAPFYNPPVKDSVKETIYSLHQEDPVTNSVPNLARQFGFKQNRVAAWLRLLDLRRQAEADGTILGDELVHAVEEKNGGGVESRDDKVRYETKQRKPMTFWTLDEEIDERVVLSDLRRVPNNSGRRGELPQIPPEWEPKLPKAVRKTRPRKRPAIIVDITNRKGIDDLNRPILVHERNGLVRRSTWRERVQVSRELSGKPDESRLAPEQRRNNPRLTWYELQWQREKREAEKKARGEVEDNEPDLTVTKDDLRL